MIDRTFISLWILNVCIPHWIISKVFTYVALTQGWPPKVGDYCEIVLRWRLKNPLLSLDLLLQEKPTHICIFKTPLELPATVLSAYLCFHVYTIYYLALNSWCQGTNWRDTFQRWTVGLCSILNQWYNPQSIDSSGHYFKKFDSFWNYQ